MLHRFLIALALVSVPLGVVACSHDENPHASTAAHADRTTGDEHARAHDHAPVQATAQADVVQGDVPTAMDQSESAEDLEITRQIRAAVVGDSSLSFGARNCTIITRGTIVTLRGNVTHAESLVIERHAHEAPGVTRVDNLLDMSDAASAH